VAAALIRARDGAELTTLTMRLSFVSTGVGAAHSCTSWALPQAPLALVVVDVSSVLLDIVRMGRGEPAHGADVGMRTTNLRLPDACPTKY